MHTHANARSMKIDLMQYAVTAYTQRRETCYHFSRLIAKPKLTNQPYYSYMAKYQCLLHKLVLIYTQCYSRIHVQNLESQKGLYITT